MTYPELLAIALALALDAFAVAIVSGLTLNPMTGRHIFRLAFHFGLFQALMPTIGWFAGIAVHGYIAGIDHWIACALLALVGSKMIWEAINGREEDRIANDPTTGWSLVLLSIATSIDALAVGLTLAMIGSTIVVPAIVIGVVAGVLTLGGMILGRRLGSFWGKRVEVLGGLILIGIGIKIVVEHLTG